MCNLWLVRYFGPRNWFVMLVSSFDPVLTFKANMAPGGHLENCIFDTLVPSVMWLMLCGVFGGNEIIYDGSLMIRLGLDLQMQGDHHVANFGPIGLLAFMVLGIYFGSGNCDLLSYSWLGIILIFKFEIVHVIHLNLLTLLTHCHHHYCSNHCYWANVQEPWPGGTMVATCCALVAICHWLFPNHGQLWSDVPPKWNGTGNMWCSLFVRSGGSVCHHQVGGRLYSSFFSSAILKL